jgi:dUTP pyrophosphatase
MLNKIQISVKRLDHSKGLALPKIQTKLAAGVDLSAAIKDPVILRPSERKIIPTGLAVALPIGFEAQIRPRSGLAIKSGITVLNSPGTIDADYRGEIGVILINLSKTDFIIERGMRIAQMVINPVVGSNWDEVEILPETNRGTSGFGSTGTEKIEINLQLGEK